MKKLCIVLAFLALPSLSFAKMVINQSPILNLQSGLVGYWTFDGQDTNWVTGKVFDRSGHGNTGTITNMSSSTAPTAGKLGQAFKFDGVNDYVNAGSAASLDDIQLQSGGAMTVAFWINPASNISNTIISKGAAANNTGYWQIAKMNSTNPARLIFSKEGATDSTVNYNNFLNIGKWQHVVLVWNGSMTFSTGVIAYKNGVLFAQVGGGTDGATANSDAANNLFIGSGQLSGTGTAFSDESLDDVRIYNRVLSAQEIQYLYQLGQARVNSSPVVSLQSGLVGYWTFDGQDTNWKTGKTFDRSGKGNTGTMTSMTSSTVPVAGKLGQAFKFDGVDDWVKGPTSATLNPANISISFWIKLLANPASGNGSIIEKGGTAVWRIRWGSTSVGLQFLHEGVTAANTGAFPLNKWMHVVGVGNASGTRFYVNSVAGALDAVAYAGTGTTASNLDIGANNGGTQNNNMILDDVRIYNRALSAQEVQYLYRLGTATVNAQPLSQSGLVGWWTMDGQSTNWKTGKVFDSSGQGKNGTLTGFTTSTAPTAGRLGQALKFDGINDYINLDVGTPTQSESILGWVKISRLNGENVRMMYMRDNTVTAELDGVFMTDTLVRFQVDDGTGFHKRLWNFTWNPKINTWYHIAVTQSTPTATPTMYLNAVSQTVTLEESVGSPTRYSSQAAIGRDGGVDQNYWEGAIDDVRIYNRALSPQEIQQLYNL